MLIGLNRKQDASSAAPAAENNFIFDATTAGFEQDLLKASMDRPVLIDFWAPWCGPCKQLMPMLEQLVAARQGKVALAKVNIDEHPQLAQAFRVQSVPMVVAMYRGQPVTGFAGVRPQKDIEHVLEQLIALHNQNQPEALDIPAALKDAALMLDGGDLAGAQNLYAQILTQDALQVEAYVGMVRVMIAAGDMEQATGMIEGAPEQISSDPRFGPAKTALELAEKAQQAGDMSAIERHMMSDPTDLQAKYDYAEAAFAKGFKDKAVDALIDSIRTNKSWENEKAKQLLLKYFESWGFADPASVAGRRKLSSVLFS